MSMFRKPSAKKLGLKVLVMGEKGVGKSVFALSFPRVYAMDAEIGMAWYEDHPVFGKNILGVYNTQDFNQLQDAMDELSELDDTGSLVIDSETKFYQNLTDVILRIEEDKAIRKGKDAMDSNVSVRGWGRIKSVATRLQNLKIDLSAKGFNIVSVSQIEDIKQKIGENFVKVGEKPVAQKGIEYDYDVVIKLYNEADANGNVIYKGLILKDRTGVTNRNDVINNPSYEVWRGYLENRKDGEMLNSSLSKDKENSKKVLEEEDAKSEKTTPDKFKELMTKSDLHKKKALELIKEKGIKNPLNPSDLKELKDLEFIVSELEKM